MAPVERDRPSATAFDFNVCSPKWLAANFDNELVGRTAANYHNPTSTVRFGTGYVFMQRWDYAALHAAMMALSQRFEAPDWSTLANRIGRILEWEFDYRYDEERSTANRSSHPPGQRAPSWSPRECLAGQARPWQGLRVRRRSGRRR